MTDTEKKIAEILEALEKATPGPWTKFENRIYGKAQPAVEPIICEFYEEETERDRNNAHLIANAPEWLRFLLDELERLEQERNMYKASSEVFYERLKKADEERQKLIDGLLTIMDIASEDGVHWKLDRCYTTARDILKEVGVLSR